jgi:uncharacterized membrane protein YbhN (UPF0104 family)
MVFDATARRRWLGALFLLAALLMLLAGQWVSVRRIGPLAFLLYWAVCFGFTFLAMATAFFDLRAIRRRRREEERALLEATFKDIPHPGSRKRPPGSGD